MPVDVIVDLDALKERVGGDTQLLGEIVELFLNEYPPVMARVKDAVASGDSERLERSAHSLRGFLLNLQAERASSAALELEIKGRRSDCVDTDKVLSKLEQEIGLVVAVLAAKCF